MLAPLEMLVNGNNKAEDSLAGKLGNSGFFGRIKRYLGRENHNVYRNPAGRVAAAASLILLVGAAAKIANAKIHYVNPGQSIQARIDDPNVVAGDEVHVRPGTYYEKVTMKDGVDLKSTDGPDVTIIDANGSHHYGVVYAENIQDPNTTVAGFTLRNGGYSCSGVQLAYSYMVIERNIIRNNGGQSGNIISGGGIYVFESVAIINHNDICNSHQGGIYIYYTKSSPSTITNNIVIGNSFFGIGVSRSTPPNLFNNDVWNNKDNNYGGVSPGPGDISEDPQFIGNKDYHLQPGSPCIDAGKDIGLPYHGLAPDMGVFEYVPEDTIVNNQIQQKKLHKP